MKKYLVFLTLVIFIVSNSLASTYKAGESIQIAENDTVATDLFTGARYLDVYGYVNGDVYAGCERVSIEGYVADDVLAGCRNLIIKGVVHDGVIGFAESILIDGEVQGDVLAYGGQVRVTERAIIKGNIFLGTGDFRLEGGEIGGTIKGGGGEVYLNGQVGGLVELSVGKIKFGKQYNAPAGTKLTLHHEINLDELENAPANLEVTYEEKEYFFQSGFFYWSFISLLIVGILIIFLLKNFSRDYLDTASDNALRKTGLGALIVIVAPIVVAILMILVFTIPVGLILLVLYLILLYLSSVFAALFMGEKLLQMIQKERSSAASLFWPLLIGILIITFIVKIPSIGWLINLAIISFGSGSLVAYIWKLKQPAENQTA